MNAKTTPALKRKTLCKNGNTVIRWYDRHTRSTVIQTLDPSGNQVGDADYSGNKQSADFAHARILEANNAHEWTNESLAAFSKTLDAEERGL